MRKFLAFLLFGITLTLTSWAETHLILVRHGQTDWNAASLLQGHSDIPLNETGKQQAQTLSEKIVKSVPKIDAIYSSDLGRAHSTALPTAEKYAIPIQKRSSLREINWGAIEGMPVDDPYVDDCFQKEDMLPSTYPDRKERWDIAVAPNAETRNQVLDRFQKELFAIAQEHPDQTVLVFSHGGPIKFLLSDLFDVDEYLTKLENCAQVHITIDVDAEQPIIFHKIEKLEE